MANETQIGMAEIKLTDAEIKAATRVLESGALRQGKECDMFEAEFAEYVGAKYAVTASNGSATLHLYYMSEDFKPGDEVLVPSFTFIATGSMPAYEGLKPIMCETDPETFLIDLKDAESKITEKTKAISPVHLFGNACDVDAIMALAKKYNLKVLWDAAQAHGTTYNGKDIGAYADAVSWSFYPSKNMFVGEGGIICTDDEELATRMRFMRTHGQTGKYYHTMLGLNYRMTDVEAAIGREQLKRLDDMLVVRRRNGEMLRAAFEKLPGLTVQKTTPNSEHSYHQFCMVVNPDTFGCNRDQLMAYLGTKKIATGVHYPRGMHKQPIFHELFKDIPETLPVTDYLSDNIVALPVHHGMSVEDVERVIDAVEMCYKDSGQITQAA